MTSLALAAMPTHINWGMPEWALH